MKPRGILLCITILLFSISLPLHSQPIITVLDFTTNNVSEQDMRSIISLLSSGLFKTGKFTVIDVSQRSKILEELEFASSGCTDESCQLEIGKLLSAEMIVTGNISKMGNRFILSAKTLETETGKTLSTSDGIYKSLEELIDSMFTFADVLSENTAYVAEVPEPLPDTREPQDREGESEGSAAPTEAPEDVIDTAPREEEPEAVIPLNEETEPDRKDYPTEAVEAVAEPPSGEKENELSIYPLIHTGNLRVGLSPFIYLYADYNIKNETETSSQELELGTKTLISLEAWHWSNIDLEYTFKRLLKDSTGFSLGAYTWFYVNNQGIYDYLIELGSNIDAGFVFSGISVLSGLSIDLSALIDYDQIIMNLYFKTSYLQELSEESEIEASAMVRLYATPYFENIFQPVGSIIIAGEYTAWQHRADVSYRYYLVSGHSYLDINYDYNISGPFWLLGGLDMTLSDGLSYFGIVLGMKYTL